MNRPKTFGFAMFVTIVTVNYIRDRECSDELEIMNLAMESVGFTFIVVIGTRLGVTQG